MLTVMHKWNAVTPRALFQRHLVEFAQSECGPCPARECLMDSIIYLVGLIVIVMFILSFLGLH